MDSPSYIFEKMKRDFNNIQQFVDLVNASQEFYEKNGDLEMLKIFIPKSNKITEDNFRYLHDWTPEKAFDATEELIELFNRKILMDSYLREEAEDGYFLAFTTKVNCYIQSYSYYSLTNFVLKKGLKNGIKLSFKNWEKHIPIQYHRAWHNRYQIADSFKFLDKSLAKDALFDGKQNWVANHRYPKIENWEPKGEFISVVRESNAFDMYSDEEAEQYRLKLLELYP